MVDHADITSTSDYRLTRVEREVAELRSKIESGQGAMLQAVAGVQTQIAQFQVSIVADLGQKYVTQREAADLAREVRERAQANVGRLDKMDQLHMQNLEDARKEADSKRLEDGRRTLQINLALIASVLSFISALTLHFVKI